MVAIPVGYDQPGVAARIAYHGTGEFIEVDELTTDHLRVLIEKVLQNPNYRERAKYFQKVISKTRGLDAAADIIEQAFQKHEAKVARLGSGSSPGGAVEERYNVAIIGAGFSGLGMAARLKESGEDSFVILEKADRLGGTWRENTYPGCACDIPSHLYWYSFDAQPRWSRVFSPQGEILDKLQSFAERRGLRPHIRFKTELTSARWDEARSCWLLATKDGGEITATALIGGWGQLNRWRLPDLPGRNTFQGTAFHSAEWRHDVALEGKRVA
jgi:NADPH-dependent 2,4-dienoyl-CoA reductase/sulfur reductase-like enzyme